MSGFIFCLIFIQVIIFLVLGIVLVSTFYLGIRKPARAPQRVLATSIKAVAPATADVTLTRSELEFLLAG